MESIIKKAIRGGWNPKCYPELEHSSKLFISEKRPKDLEYMVKFIKQEWKDSQIVCDPLFWQALGKTLGWFNADGTSVAKYINNDPKHTKKEMWIWYALKFHEINLTEGWDKAVAYLEEVIK